MKIRRATVRDAQHILDLLIKTPQLQGYGEMDAIHSRDYVLDCITDKKVNLVLVAEDRGDIVGLLIAELWAKKKYSFLMEIVVVPSFRSQGIGKKLYGAYEVYCKKENLKILVALVQTDNSSMQRFIEKIGYKKGHAMYFYEKDL